MPQPIQWRSYIALPPLMGRQEHSYGIMPGALLHMIVTSRLTISSDEIMIRRYAWPLK
jgi:hypothetical protein